jgi:TRAP-type C4-dicarboxylate transport system substrate-binding protein
VYQALSQGVVSGSVAGAVLITSFKLNELVKYHLEGIPMGAPAGFIVMNRQAYEKLSPKGKQVLDRFTGETMSREFGTFFMELGLGAAKQLRNSKDQQFAALSAQEKARWISALEPVIQSWVKATPQGDKVLASFRADLKAAPSR